jgi:post-segregation antitoxin (ccd killing protein)
MMKIKIGLKDRNREEEQVCMSNRMDDVSGCVLDLYREGSS